MWGPSPCLWNLPEPSLKLLLGPGPRPGGHRGRAAGGGQGDQAQGAAPQADQQDEAAAGERKIVTPFHHVNVSGIAIIILLSQTEPVHSPEDNPSFSPELTKEKTLVEILLRKYGFGQWSVVSRQRVWQLAFQYSHIFRTRATATFSLQVRTCKPKVP